VEYRGKEAGMPDGETLGLRDEGPAVVGTLVVGNVVGTTVCLAISTCPEHAPVE